MSRNVLNQLTFKVHQKEIFTRVLLYPLLLFWGIYIGINYNKMLFNIVHGHGQILNEGLGYSSHSVIVLVDYVQHIVQCAPFYLN